MWASPIAAFCSELRECGQCGPFAVLMGQHRKKKRRATLPEYLGFDWNHDLYYYHTIKFIDYIIICS